MHRTLFVSRPRAESVLIAALCFGWSPYAGAIGLAPPVVWSVTTTDDYPPDVAPAPGGGVYVTRSDSLTGGSISRLDASGSQIWRQELGSYLPASTVAADGVGNVLIGGQHFRDGYLRKYSPTGNLLWHHQIATPQLFNWPTGIGVDPGGNAYVAIGPWESNYGIPPPGTYSTLRRINASGQLEWLRDLDTRDGYHPGNGSVFSNGTVVDHQGHVFSMLNNYATTSDGTRTSTMAYLSKTTSDGQVFWMKSLGRLSNVYSIGVDSNDNIYAAVNDLLLKFDNDGNQIWSRSSNNSRLFSLAVGPRDEIFVAGDSLGAPYVAEYDINGILIWDDTQPVLQEERMTYYGLTISGGKLIGGAVIAKGSHWDSNLVRAYRLVPEPQGLTTMALFAIGVAFARWRRLGFPLQLATSLTPRGLLATILERTF